MHSNSWCLPIGPATLAEISAPRRLPGKGEHEPVGLEDFPFENSGAEWTTGLATPPFLAVDDLSLDAIYDIYDRFSQNRPLFYGTQEGSTRCVTITVRDLQTFRSGDGRGSASTDPSLASDTCH
jgi:hypothetical protein